MWPFQQSKVDCREILDNEINEIIIALKKKKKKEKRGRLKGWTFTSLSVRIVTDISAEVKIRYFVPRKLKAGSRDWFFCQKELPTPYSFHPTICFIEIYTILIRILFSEEPSLKKKRTLISIALLISCVMFWTSVRSVALEKEQWQTWGL